MTRNPAMYVAKDKTLHIIGRSVNKCSHFGNKSEDLKNEIELLYDPAISLLDIYSKESVP